MMVTDINDVVEMSVDFASITSARLADEYNLDATDFNGVEPSRMSGFTVSDVRVLYERVGGETPVPSVTSDNIDYTQYEMAYLSHSANHRGEK